MRAQGEMKRLFSVCASYLSRRDMNGDRREAAEHSAQSRAVLCRHRAGAVLRCERPGERLDSRGQEETARRGDASGPVIMIVT